MTTRADFYVGRGPDAEWLGSIAMDGYPGEPGVDATILSCESEFEYRRAIRATLSSRDDATPPYLGWPWPWEDSFSSDFAYAWEDGMVWVSHFGGRWFDPRNIVTVDEITPVEFPDMTAIQKVAFGPRSGTMVFGGPA